VTRKAVTRFALEFVAIVALALALAVGIQAYVVKPYRIPSGSMLPTLHPGERVLVDRVGNDLSSPQIGDIYVFHPPKNWASGCADPNEGENQEGQYNARPCAVAQAQPSSQAFIKRVVGLPGDRISIRDGHVIRNGVRERDPYIWRCGDSGACSFPGTVTIPANEYFMMGDHRGDSDDSRFWGPVRRSWLVGPAFFVYWPPDRIGTL
jgi:signal peptidase I